MKFVDEYRDATIAQHYAQVIAQITTQPWEIMEICPSHCYLDDVVQISDCAVAADFYPTPNHWIDAQDENMKLVDNKLLRIAHWVILPHCRKKSLSFDCCEN